MAVEAGPAVLPRRPVPRSGADLAVLVPALAAHAGARWLWWSGGDAQPTSVVAQQDSTAASVHRCHQLAAVLLGWP